MTIAENPQKPNTLDFRDPHILVARTDGAVQVAVRNRQVSPELVRRLRHVLLDLTQGQGNLAISVELPELVALNTDLLDVLLETAEHLTARRGTLNVRTAVGDWSRPPAPPDDVA